MILIRRLRKSEKTSIPWPDVFKEGGYTSDAYSITFNHLYEKDISCVANLGQRQWLEQIGFGNRHRRACMF